MEFQYQVPLIITYLQILFNLHFLISLDLSYRSLHLSFVWEVKTWCRKLESLRIVIFCGFSKKVYKNMVNLSGIISLSPSDCRIVDMKLPTVWCMIYRCVVIKCPGNRLVSNSCIIIRLNLLLSSYYR